VLRVSPFCAYCPQPPAVAGGFVLSEPSAVAGGFSSKK